MKTEIICDTNIFYSYKSLDQLDSNEYLASYYNFQDLLMSKGNINYLDERLRKTISSKLQDINKHNILIFEPHFYIINDIFPDSKIGKILYDRIDPSRSTSYIYAISDILRNGDSCSPATKEQVKKLTEYAQKKDIENNKQIREYASLLYKNIGYTSRDQVKPCSRKSYLNKIS